MCVCVCVLIHVSIRQFHGKMNLAESIAWFVYASAGLILCICFLYFFLCFSFIRALIVEQNDEYIYWNESIYWNCSGVVKLNGIDQRKRFITTMDMESIWKWLCSLQNELKRLAHQYIFAMKSPWMHTHKSTHSHISTQKWWYFVIVVNVCLYAIEW